MDAITPGVREALAYLALVAGTAIEGEVVLVSFAALAHAGRFALPLVIVFGALGSALSTYAYFWLARRNGRSWVERRLAHRPGATAAYRRALAMVEHRGTLLMIIARYLVGVRSAIPIACGLVGMAPARFALANAIGALLWAIPVGWLGYTSARSVRRVLDDLEHAEWLVVLAAVAVGLLLWLTRWRRAASGRPPAG